MIYITGDKHCDFSEVNMFCYLNTTDKNDLLIVLGDAGINYFANERDYILKNNLSQIPITFFCIHGNHEERPENIKTYKTKKYLSGIVYYEDKYPNILFAKSGEVYNIDNKKTLVIGGAYSVDKHFRLSRGLNWYESEQLTDKEQEDIFNKVKGKNYDLVLTHTCPKKYEPVEVFLQGLDQSKIDKTMELFLDKIEENITYKKWYCGHYHTEKEIDKLEFMYHNIKKLDKGGDINASISRKTY